MHKVTHLTMQERRAAGRSARELAPRSKLGRWEPSAGRPDPVTLIEEQNASREADLVPVRHGRMMVSPFTFYRGTARIQAEDLQHIPRAGLVVQLCGDAHLSNFGVYASPERALLFDLNDFDETLPGPFEYDVARLATSFVVAARDNAFTATDARDGALTAASAYRDAMRGFADMRTMEVWYSRFDAQSLLEAVQDAGAGGPSSAAKKQLARARSKDSLKALSKLTEVVDGRHRIVSDPPLIVPARMLGDMYGLSADQVEANVHGLLRAYREALLDDRRHLLERFELVDVARKVVGVGSVGTRAWIVLFLGRDGDDPLFLQVKEATASVLEGHLPKSTYGQAGERVVQGQRLMQSASDIFLGWTEGVEANRYYYWRQLRDMKGSARIERFDPSAMVRYARACGWTLARAHARSGDPVAIASYLGASDTFDRAMAEFAVRYADQNERDFEAFVGAVRSGRLPATEET